MDTARNVYKVTSQNPGSDVAAETAAALAAASIVFKDSDPSYSTKLLKTKNGGVRFCDSIKGLIVTLLVLRSCVHFICSYWIPWGLFYKGSESNLQYVTTSSFLLLAYAKYLRSHGGVASCGTSTTTSDKLVALAKKQVDYILGNNPAKMSYMVGFGPSIHNMFTTRGSSLPSLHVHPTHISHDGFQISTQTLLIPTFLLEL
ncbi:hypothetical protein DH2020_047307 [Rehmannia glutinosa]|uniref:cellulase n=1 Tax=Rehmannia glutinosa TaxID=99300 RepID=A0ABR0UAE0_REHGL